MDADSFRRVSLVLVVGGLALLAGIVLPLAGSTADAALADQGRRGASQFGAMIQDAARAAGGPEPQTWFGHLAGLPEPAPRASLLVLGPARPFTAAEADAVARFFDAGGRVVLADDGGAANSLLERLPTRSRVQPGLLLDLAYSRQPRFPLLTDIEPHALTAGVRTLVANEAAVLRADASATVLVRSSAAAWLDRDGDGAPGREEPNGPFPVVLVERIGNGELILLSDPSLLTNEMVRVQDNGILANALARRLADRAALVHVDESHREPRPFARLADLVPGLPAGARVALVLLVVAVPAGVAFAPRLAALARERVRLRRANAQAREDPVETVLREHPTWRARDLRRLAEHLMKGPS